MAVSGLAYAPPSGEELFSNVSFRLGRSAHVGLVGANGVGKSTLLGVLARRLEPTEGTVHADGAVLYMPQDVGIDEGLTVRQLLARTLPPEFVRIHDAIAQAEHDLARGDDAAGMQLGESIAEWSELGGYQIEADWDTACRATLGVGLDELAPRAVEHLSGGERKRLLLEVLFASPAGILLLDEPDNHLDIPAKRALEERLRATAKTVLVVSHDRELLTGAVTSILTLEGTGCWRHAGDYGTYVAARAERQRKLAADRRRWLEEERRLRELTRVFKERARYSSDWAVKAKAMETRWRRWQDSGMPPAPVSEQPVVMRIRGGDSARRVIKLHDLGIDGVVRPIAEEEVFFGERVGLVGPNGTGKSHLLGIINGEPIAHTGTATLGPRVNPGLFTQHNLHAEHRGRTPLQLAHAITGRRERALSTLARYGLIEAAERPTEALSGGQRARLEILLLELSGHNLLLLDEPTDNLDLASTEALEQALDGFEGTVLAVSHDRAFLRKLDRFLHLDERGNLERIPDPSRALERLTGATAMSVS